MISQSKEQIIVAFNDYLLRCGEQSYANHYVGITDNAERRLFEEHKVDRDGVWIYCKAIDKGVAQSVEEYFQSMGMSGDTGGGNTDSLYVYCYAITPTTIQ